MKVVHAVFENGVFRPRESVELPEGSVVEFEPRLVPGATPESQGPDRSHWARVHALLSQSIETGESDTPTNPDGREQVPDRNHDHLKQIHALLGRRIETGETDMAERHDEPLP